DAAGEEGAGLSGMGSTGFGSGPGDAGSTTGGSGLTGGTRRDEASLDAGTTGSRAMGGPGAGTGEVHSGLSVGRDVDTGYSAIAPAATGSSWEPSSGSGEGGAMNRVRDAAGQARERLQGLNVSGRAGDVAGQAREKAGQALGRAEQVLEERGILDKVRENPMPALGVAFGIGFLLAGSGDQVQGKRSTAMYKAKNQLKGAIMGGLSAAVAQEGRNLLGMAQGKGSAGGLVGMLLQNLQGGGSGGGASGGSAGTAPHRRPSHQEMR
ncbi:MAG TPA: hypothetical protein VGV85_07985, partial [Longimicrobiaceae bacterium]|nr:hypothetical protein [Longimicrobiaceae bacterium]